jgi:aldehyde dehydrogenase (NAD+)
MQEEIFGPILPIISYHNLDDLLDRLKTMERPLACYVFAEDSAVSKKVVTELPFGGGCVNDTMMHISNNHLPFGGVGNSGMNVYHGKYSFDAFSHKKGVINSSTSVDLELRYAPFDEKKLKLLKKLI